MGAAPNKPEKAPQPEKTVLFDRFGRALGGNAEEMTSDERRTKWLNHLADEFTKLEAFMPKSFLPEEGDSSYPEWVRRVEREFADVMFPIAKVKKALKLTPGNLGGMLGHQCAFAVWMLEWLEAEEPEEKVEDGKFKGILTVKNMSMAEIEKGLLAIDNIVEKWYPGMARLAKLALSSSVDQGYEEMKDFLTAFAAGFARKPKTFRTGDMGNTTFEIYLFMLSFWRTVDNLESVSQLHQILVQVIDSHRIGEKKRIEKICQRIALPSSGTPQEAKIIQTLKFFPVGFFQSVASLPSRHEFGNSTNRSPQARAQSP